MPALHATSTYNVEATLSQWVITKFATITLPLTVNYMMVTLQPNIPIVTPSFSITHQPADRVGAYQGDVVGNGEVGVDAINIMQISAWVSRTNNPNWLAQLRAMESMIEALVASPKMIRLQDYLTAPASPSNVNYIVRIQSCGFIATPHDPNPDIERVSANIVYSWVLRTNVT